MSRATSRKSKKSGKSNGKHSSNSKHNQSASAAPHADEMSQNDDEMSLQSLRDAISDQMEAEVQRRNSSMSEANILNSFEGANIVHVTITNEYPPMKDFQIEKLKFLLKTLVEQSHSQ